MSRFTPKTPEPKHHPNRFMGFGLSNSKLIQKEKEKANGTRKPCPNSEITVLRLGQEIDVERTVYLYQSEAQKLALDLDLKGEILGIVRIYILDGKNLMIKDPILGGSDPYVSIRPGTMVLKQDIRRTKVINQNLNPEWNEFFDYYVLGPIKFIFNLYDKDLVVQDDPLGRCEFDFDDSWIDTKTRGEELILPLKEGDLGKEIAEGYISDTYDSPSTGPVTSGEFHFKVYWQRLCSPQTMSFYKQGIKYEERKRIRQQELNQMVDEIQNS